MVESLYCAISGETSNLDAIFVDHVIGWSPIARHSNVDDVRSVFAEREGSFTNVAIKVNSLVDTGSKVMFEWNASFTHSGRFDCNGLTIEPHGYAATLAGAMVADLQGDRISSFRVYFDTAALLAELTIPI